ncbi:MAG: PIN domain-containing protein [Novosphingobium sp.]|nr:PIN domain-containing protein [Novosphingobium sp.]
MLIDTNVWSELSRPRPDASVSAWARLNFDKTILSAIVFGEIQYGIALAEGNRRKELQAFLDELMLRLNGVVADFDDEAASVWGSLRARLKKAGNLFGERDMLIAAHALSLGTPLVTRNVSEMIRSGATVINPWEP